MLTPPRSVPSTSYSARCTPAGGQKRRGLVLYYGTAVFHGGLRPQVEGRGSCRATVEEH